MEYLKFSKIKHTLHPSFSQLIDDEKILTVKLHNDTNNLLFHNKRFDLISKYLLIKSYDNNINIQWYKDVYHKTIEAFNNFYEDNIDTVKQGKEVFYKNFINLFEDIKKNGYDYRKSLIPINKEGVIIDGSHRLAICAYLNIPIKTVEINSNTDFNFNFFESKNLEQIYLDYIALSYCIYNKNARVALLFPVANESKDHEVIRTFDDNGGIFYKKSIILRNNAANFIIKELYKNNDWIGNNENMFKGALEKEKACFSGHAPLRLIIYNSRGINKDIKTKEIIRNIFLINNHSVHSTDTHNEAIRCCQMLLNPNNIHHLNFLRINNFPNFNTLFTKFQKNNTLIGENIILDGSATLAAYGIRDVSDLDYISLSSSKLNKIENINNHSDTLKYHQKSPEELIHDPINHFFYMGFKFISIDQLSKMKKQRNEKKDIGDLILMKPFLKNNFSVDYRKVITYRTYKHWNKLKVLLKQILPSFVLKLLSSN